MLSLPAYLHQTSRFLQKSTQRHHQTRLAITCKTAGVLMERESALKNIFHRNHLYQKLLLCCYCTCSPAPWCTVVPVAALLPPRPGAHCASGSIWARLFLILHLSSYSLTATPSSGHGSLLEIWWDAASCRAGAGPLLASLCLE